MTMNKDKNTMKLLKPKIKNETSKNIFLLFLKWNIILGIFFMIFIFIYIWLF